jgi:hypothetical protein
MIDEGYSSGKVKDLIGATTRNVVIGKAYRLGLRFQGRKMETAQDESLPAKRNHGKKPPLPALLVEVSSLKTALTMLLDEDPVVEPPPIVQDEPQALKTLMELGYMDCRWPVDVEGGFLFCGQVKDRGSYCLAHAKHAFTGKMFNREPGYSWKPAISRKV